MFQYLIQSSYAHFVTNIFFCSYKPGLSNTRAFCAARDAFWEFQIINKIQFVFFYQYLQVLGQRINKFLLNERRVA